MNISKGLVSLLFACFLMVGCDDSSTGTQQEEQSSNSESYSVPEDFDYSAYWENNEAVQNICGKLDSLCLERHWGEEGEDANLSYEAVVETSSEEASSAQISSATDPSSNTGQPSDSLSSGQEVSSSADTTSVSSSSDTTEYFSDAASSSSDSLSSSIETSSSSVAPSSSAACVVDSSTSMVYSQDVDSIQFSLVSGGYETVQSLELSTATSGATIYYTTDGCEPNQYSHVYSGPISIDRGMRVRAKAFKSVMNPSEEWNGYYGIQTGRDCYYNEDGGKLVCNEKVYNTTKIGTQHLMGENLGYYDAASMDSADAQLCPRYGYSCGDGGQVVYSLETVMAGEDTSSSTPSGVQGICPNGWHVPSADEMDLMAATVANQTGNMDVNARGDWSEIASILTHKGFDMYGTGYYDIGRGRWEDYNENVYWLTSTQTNTGLYEVRASYDFNNAFNTEASSSVDNLYSLRCFKD